MAETLFTTFKPALKQRSPIAQILLVAGGGGVFDVEIDGELVYSKHRTGRHADPQEIVEQVRSRLTPG